MAADPVRELIRLFELRPDEVERAVWEFAGGSVAAAVADGILEGFATPERPFPYWEMPVLPDILPPLDDLIVAVAGPVVTAIGIGAKDRDIARIGVGLSIYGVPMWLKTLVTRLVRKFKPAGSLGGGGSSPLGGGTRQQGRYRVTG